MSLSLNTINKSKAGKSRKRVGRGNASGHGTYSCRGIKGQKSRSGASGLIRLGLKRMLLATPKSRGFKSSNPDNQVVNISVINLIFKDGEKINPRSLARAGLITSAALPIKILGDERLKIKNAVFTDVKMSGRAKEFIGEK
ncbi:MAG: uL15 family ribosomal protein [Patescibacteria group bacterium]|jgi:large subunit ribosomal protein L15